jgi:PAS domain S-box-containing protein
MQERLDRVLLLFDHTGNRQLLANLLRQEYQLVLPEKGMLPDAEFDLCVVDGQAMARFDQQIQQRRRADQPLFLPVLLVTSQQDVRVGESQLWELIDDLAISPVDPLELRAKLRMLLRTRHLSLESKQQSENLNRISMAIKHAGDAIMVADGDGRLVYANQAFVQVSGKPQPTTLEEVESLFLDSELAEHIFTEALVNGKSWHGEVELRQGKHGLINTLLRVDSVRDSQLQMHGGIVGVFTDVTEMKQVRAAELEQRLLAEALQDTATALTGTLVLTEVFDRILVNVGKVVPHDAADIMVIEDGTVSIVRSREFGTFVFEVDHTRSIPIEAWSHLYRMFTTGKTLIISDVYADPDQMDILQNLWIRSYVGAPIKLRGKILGFINLHSATPNFYTPVHAERLEAFARQAAIAIQNARMYEQAQEIATVKERQRLARDIHDAISQTLFSATMITEALPRMMDEQPEKAKQMLLDVHNMARGALAETRTLLFELRPEALAGSHIGELLRQLAWATRSRKEIDIRVDVSDRVDLPPEAKIVFYRIAQEALNNVIKYAKAHQVIIEYRTDKENATLTIEDDGIGFDVNTTKATGLGLSIMRERAQMIEAQLRIESRLGKGTLIQIIWPLEEKHD